MSTPPAELLRAERMRAVLGMPEYQDTVGKWIREAMEQALHDMTMATDVIQMHTAQGAYRALTGIKENMDRIFDQESAFVKKLNKQRTTS